MKLLAFDGVTNYASVAVSDGELRYVKTWQVDRGHSEQLAPAVHGALQRSRLRPSDLNGIAVGTGPGSYTGIRIALSLAKGLALASGVPLVGISTLETLAYGCAAWSGDICAVSPLGPDRLALGVFQGPWSDWQRIEPDRGVAMDQANTQIPNGSLVCGPGVKLCDLPPATHLAPAAYDIPAASHLAGLAERYFSCGGQDQSRNVAPNYLRSSTPEERLDHREAKT